MARHVDVKRIIWGIVFLAVALLIAVLIKSIIPERNVTEQPMSYKLMSAEAVGSQLIKLTLDGDGDALDADHFQVAASSKSWASLDGKLDEMINITAMDKANNELGQTVLYLQLDTTINPDGTRHREVYRGMLPLLTADKYYSYDINTDMVKADRLITWQTELGGWDQGLHESPDPKDELKVRIDRAWDAQEPRSQLVDSAGQEVGTIENGATINEMILIGKIYRESGDRRYKTSLLQAIDYLLAAQYDSGGWPLAYPLLGGQTDAVVYEGNATIRVMNVLKMIEQFQYPFDYSFVDETRQAQMTDALNRGLNFILQTQLRDDEELSTWAVSYDPVTLQPNEQSVIAPDELVEIIKYLMSIQTPSDEVSTAIEGAMNYLSAMETATNEHRLLINKLRHVYETTGYYEDHVFVQLHDDEPLKVKPSASGKYVGVEPQPLDENKYAEQVEEKIIPLSEVEADKLIVVSQYGDGDYADVQAAIDAVPDDNTEPVTIYIKEGVYHQKLIIPSNKPYITMIGESKFDTVLTHLEITGTGFNGNSTIIEANDFTAINLTFANEAGAIGTAAAVEVRGDRGYFEGVRFLGYQDTLYLNAKNGGRFYFHDCYIEGAVDYIYGPGTAFIENSVIFNKRSGGYITAASTPEEQAYGIIFHNNIITGYPWVENVYFGRPWRDYANDVFLHSWIDQGMIALQGWHNWGSREKEKTARYYEFGSYGPGANIRLRANWVKQLSSDEALEYTAEKVLAGADGWAPYN